MTTKEKPSNVAKDHGVGDGTMAAGQQTAMRTIEGGSQMLAATVQFGVDREKANAALHEARGKMIKVLEEMMKAQGDRAQDAVQGLVQGRKASFDTVENVLKNGQQANVHAISSISR